MLSEIRNDWTGSQRTGPDRLWLGKKLVVQTAEVKQRHCGACRQAARPLKNYNNRSSYKDQKGEDCGGQRGGVVFTIPSVGVGGGGRPPLNQGEAQYLTLRDLSSHDQDRGEGKVGREDAAVPKGPLPIWKGGSDQVEHPREETHQSTKTIRQGCTHKHGGNI